MTEAQEKICWVVKHLVTDSEMNPDPRWARYEFNEQGFWAEGVPDSREERNILRKLRSDGLITLHIPNEYDDMEGYWAALNDDEILEKVHFINVEFLSGFREYARKTCPISTSSHSRTSVWVITNPFWWAYKAWKEVWGFLSNHGKSIGSGLLAAIAVGGMLFWDYSLGWKNVLYISHIFTPESVLVSPQEQTPALGTTSPSRQP